MNYKSIDGYFKQTFVAAFWRYLVEISMWVQKRIHQLSTMFYIFLMKNERERGRERERERERERVRESEVRVRESEWVSEREREIDEGVEVFDWLLFDQLISKLHVSDFDVASLKLICTYLRAKINDKYNLKKSY